MPWYVLLFCLFSASVETEIHCPLDRSKSGALAPFSPPRNDIAGCSMSVRWTCGRTRFEGSDRCSKVIGCMVCLWYGVCAIVCSMYRVLTISVGVSFSRMLNDFGWGPSCSSSVHSWQSALSRWQPHGRAGGAHSAVLKEHRHQSHHGLGDPSGHATSVGTPSERRGA